LAPSFIELYLLASSTGRDLLEQGAESRFSIFIFWGKAYDNGNGNDEYQFYHDYVLHDDGFVFSLCTENDCVSRGDY
jgi:hypothetical protein